MSIKVETNSSVQITDPLKTNNTVKTTSANNTTSSPLNKTDSSAISKNQSGVSEDPFAPNDGRKILKPIGESNGRNFYFLYTLDRPFDKIAMRTPNKILVQDDIMRLRAKGYTVIVDNKTTTEDWKNAVYDPKAFGVVSLGHGGEGALVTVATNGDPEGDFITHWDIDSKKVSPNLKMVYLQACQAGMEEKAWEKALKTDVVAWTKSVSNLEVMSANGHIASAGVFPVIGAVFSIQSQIHNKALGQIISEKF